jgi:hypothetical protein
MCDPITGLAIASTVLGGASAGIEANRSSPQLPQQQQPTQQPTVPKRKRNPSGAGEAGPEALSLLSVGLPQLLGS